MEFFQGLLFNILLSYPALTLYAIFIIIGLGFLIDKKIISEKYVNISVDLFSYIEDNYKSWGIQGNDKLEFFVKTFIAKYKKDTGVVPTQEIIENAVKLIEELVEYQNKALERQTS